MALTAKTRRHSGRKTPRLVKGIPGKILLAEGLEPAVYWDDWSDYRDGQRGSRDRTQLRSSYMPASRYLAVALWNAKLQKRIMIRRSQKLIKTNL